MIMETVSPQTSPTSSISPPLTPFSIALPHTYALPPLKTLPTWNRNKFKDGKLVRSVPKNKNIKVELIGRIGQIENCTQTSPPSSSTELLSAAKKLSCGKNSSNTNRLKKSFDKKIVFLETMHKEILRNLHQELEKIKNENRALKFQLVMVGDAQIPIEHQIDNDEKVDVQITCKKTDCNETKVLKAEIKELKKLLHDADSKNIYLTKLIEQLKQRSSASRLHSGNLKTKTIPRKCDYPMPLNNNVLLQRDSSARIILKQEKSNANDREDGEPMQGSKENQNELLLLEGKLQEQSLENNFTLPKLEQQHNRSGPVPLNTSAVNRLCKRMQVPISLPVLQGLPANRNMTSRQKRAQALHVQRQRSNKNVTLTAATAMNNA